MARAFGGATVGPAGAGSTLAYLCGIDDNGPWAVRVPYCADITTALEYVEPPQVREARAAGRKILRQGDWYAVESRCDGPAPASDSHHWDAATRTLTHDPSDGRKHAPLVVPFKARWYQQRALRMGRIVSSRAGRAD